MSPTRHLGDYDPKKLLRLCELSQDLLGICTFDGVFEYMNPAWTVCLGWDLDELRSKPFLEFVHPDDIAKTLAKFEQNMTGVTLRPVTGFVNRYRTKAGGYRSLRWSTVTNMEEKLIYANALDVTDMFELIESLGEARAKLDSMARSDDLTGLLNRRGGREVLEREVARVNRFGSSSAITMFDIDYFKKINDTYSHQTGDMILQAVSTTLKNEARGIDCICRWGGEEFLAILPGITDSDARQFAQRMLNAVGAAKHALVGRVTLSAGTAEIHRGVTMGAAIAQADSRLYSAKKSGRNCVGRDLIAPPPEDKS